MKKSKSALVTVIVTALFAVIYCGLFLLYTPGFMAMTALLTLYGFIRGTADFHGWLREDEPLPPVPVVVPIDTGNREHAKHCAARLKRVATVPDTGRPTFDIDIPLD